MGGLCFVNSYMIACTRLQSLQPQCSIQDHAVTRIPPTLPLIGSHGGLAAAFAISPNVAVTALHTIIGSSRTRVADSDATLLKGDPYRDLALLELNPAVEDFFPVDFSTQPSPEDQFVVISQPPESIAAPLQLRGIDFEILLTVGNRVPLLVLHDEASVVGPGWSGAPVCDRESGEVVGVVTQVMTGGIVHAIPSRFLQLLQEDKEVVSSSYIARITTQPLVSAPARLSANARNVSGIRVARTAGKGKLQVGDIITSINGRKINSSGLINWHGAQATWHAATCEIRPGEWAEIEVVRKDESVKECIVTTDTRYAVGAIPWMRSEVVLSEGAIFAALSFDLLMAWGEHWVRDAPRDLVDAAFAERDKNQREIVVLVGSAQDCEHIWEEYRYLRVLKVDGVAVNGLSDLVCEDNAAENERRNMVVEFANGYIVSMLRGKLESSNLERELQELQQ